MKLSKFYKEAGYQVDLYKLGIKFNSKKITNTYWAKGYSKVFVSCIFAKNKSNLRVKGCKDIVYGGTGYDLLAKLAPEVERCQPDYSLYEDDEIDTSIGFITRGCIRKCKFCFVPIKEGMLHEYRPVEDLVGQMIVEGHKKIRFLDNNILAYDKHMNVFRYLTDAKIRCSFNEGLDLRLITDENAEALSKLRYYPSEYLFAFDDIKLQRIVTEKIAVVKKYIPKDWHLKVYIYCSKDMDFITEVKPRLEWCRENKVLPYLMLNENLLGHSFYSKIKSWGNYPSNFKYHTFEEYIRYTSNDNAAKDRFIRRFNGE